MFRLSKSKDINLAKLYQEANVIYERIPAMRKRRKRNRLFKILKYFSISIIVFFLPFIVYSYFHVINIKLIYQEAMTAKEIAEDAIFLIKEEEYQQALKYAQEAEKKFFQVACQIKAYKNSFLVRHLDFLDVQLDNFFYLATTAQILSKAVGQGAEFGLSLGGLLNKESKFTDLNKKQRRKLLSQIYEATPELNGFKANVDLALVNLNNIKLFSLLWPFEEKIVVLKTQLSEIENFLSKAITLSELLPPLLGYPEKSAFLVILQNNNELRPTGGIIDAYGILELADGDISRFDTYDVYRLDIFAQDIFKVEPPEDLEKYLGINRWFMRDANWSPNWPTAANQIEWFYWEENKLLPPQNQVNNFTGEFDGVIAITPEFITDLLVLVGHVYIGLEKYDQDNFADLLEDKAEKENRQPGMPNWQGKEVIGDIIKELKVKIFDLPPLALYEAFNILIDNLYKKNILVYFHDQQFQELIAKQGWAGELKETDGDYLMVVDSNMTSLETDAVISRNINYQVNQGINGLFADLQINYAHSGEFNRETTEYRTYTRVYVPLNSQLINVEEYSEGVETDDNASVQVYNELGKTVFATFLSIEPGDIGSLHYYYKLPKKIDNLAKSSQYSLYIQKQPGNEVGLLTVDLKLASRVKSYSPTGFYVYQTDDNCIKWESDLMVDKKFEVSF